MSMNDAMNLMMQRFQKEQEQKGNDVIISDPKNEMETHREDCSCPICNNGIREQLQYGALEIKDGVRIIIDAEEFVHLVKCIKNTGKKHPEYPKVEPEENGKPVLAYGVLIPQYKFKENDWFDELDKYKNFAFGTLEDEKLYVSAYSDFELFKNDAVYGSHIPCALLLETALDLTEEREFDFGHTAFVLYKDMPILNNILNRKFLFCFGGMEKNFNPEDAQTWRQYINKDELMNVAKRLF